jgi:hypothetical protein
MERLGQGEVSRGLLHMKILRAVREIGRANHPLSFLLNGACWRKLTLSACQN